MLQFAIQVALDAHKSQMRKGSSIPYIVHPMEVAIILAENGADQDVIVAGILHDTIEDTEISKEDIVRMFGIHIAELVAGASESNRDIPGITWDERKQHTIEYLKTADKKVRMIACADKLSNMRSINKDFNDIGDRLWQRFNAGYDKQKWYYTSLVESFKALAEEGCKMYFEFCQLVKDVFSK